MTRYGKPARQHINIRSSFIHAEILLTVSTATHCWFIRHLCGTVSFLRRQESREIEPGVGLWIPASAGMTSIGTPGVKRSDEPQCSLCILRDERNPRTIAIGIEIACTRKPKFLDRTWKGELSTHSIVTIAMTRDEMRYLRGIFMVETEIFEVIAIFPEQAYLSDPYRRTPRGFPVLLNDAYVILDYQVFFCRLWQGFCCPLKA